MSKEEPDIFSCSICLEHFKKPKLLPCQHTFCESCLNTYIQFSTGNDTLSSKWFLCPLCRQTVKSADINSKPREWASLMPVNSMIISLMQTPEAGATFNEENESRNCGPCKRDEEISTGSFWCPNCLEFLCENCKKFHRRMKTLEMHKIIPVEEMDKEHAKVTEFDEPCPDHVGEFLKVFCIGHKTMCCVMCLTTHHNECKEIKTLEEMAHQMEGDKSGTRFINSLDEIKTRLGETVKDREKNIAHLNGRCEFVLSQMEEIVQQAKSNLDAFLEDFESKLTSLNEAQNEIIFETKQKVECLLKTLEYGEQMLRFLSRNGHSKQLFIAIEKSKVQILDHLKHLKMNSVDDQMVDYYLSVDEILLKLKTPTSEMKLAQVEPKFETSNKQMLPVISELSVICDQQMHIQRLLSKADVSEFEAVKLWDVKGKGKISSGVFLSSGSLVCCDCINKYLLAYDENGSIICKFKLDYFPLNLDVFENEILVSAHQKNHIYAYTFKNNNFKELQKIEIPYQCKGIAVVENKIAITNGYNIDVITILGGILQSITVEDFSLASFCHIASDNSNIYYSHDDSLVEMSLNLKDVKKHKLLSFLVTKHMRGIAVDQNGNKFICDSKSDSICVVSKNCRRCRFLETNIKPFAVQCEKNGSRFFVANSKTDGVSDILLEVYDIHLKKK